VLDKEKEREREKKDDIGRITERFFGLGLGLHLQLQRRHG